VGEGPTANTGKMRWVDIVDLPRFEQGVVVAAQVARPPLGWTGAHALARCCLRTPRPFLQEGGDWRRTYVLLRPESVDAQATWMFTPWVAWSILKNPHGIIPFPGYRVLWLVTFFLDRTAGGITPRSQVMEVKAVPRWEPAEGDRDKARKLVQEKQQKLWDGTPLDRPLALPMELGREVVGALGRAQLDDPWARNVILFLREQSDGKGGPPPHALTRRDLGMAGQMRLAPDTELLEFKVVSKVSTYHVPYIPNVQCAYLEAGHTWRYWIFKMVHLTLAGGAHRAQSPTISMARRMGWWPEITQDIERWWLDCPACAKNRGKALKGIARQVHLEADEADGFGTMPWEYVVVDVEGPFAPVSEEGARYILTYRCRTIKASLLEPMTRLTRPRFARAFLACMFRSRRVPKRVYSDRGPEVRNAVINEILAVLGVDKREGLPQQPIFQGAVERDHLETKVTLTSVLHDLVRAYPTEWAFFLPAVEYMKYITPYSSGCDLCPRDLDHGWSLASDMERDAIPFQVAGAVECESEFAANLFANFLTLKRHFDRYVQTASKARAEDLNATRMSRGFRCGDIVYRKPPGFHERRTHTLAPRGCGPFVVSKVISPQTVELVNLDGTPAFKDPVSVSELVDRTPRRPTLELPEEAGTRSYADIAAEAGDEPQAVPGPRKGWGGLAKGHLVAYLRAGSDRELVVGKVEENVRQDRHVLVHCYRATWRNVAVQWKPVYFEAVAEGDKETLEVTGRPKQEPVRYAALVRVVELLVDGELAHASSRALDRSGYRLHIPESEVSFACRQWRADAPTGLVASLSGKVEALTRAAQGRHVRFSQEGLATLARDRGVVTLFTVQERPGIDGFEVVLGGRSDVSLCEPMLVGSRGWTWQDNESLDAVCRMLWIARPGWAHVGLRGGERATKVVAGCGYEMFAFQASRGAGASLSWQAASAKAAEALKATAEVTFGAAGRPWSVAGGKEGRLPKRTPGLAATLLPEAWKIGEGKSVIEVEDFLTTQAMELASGVQDLPARCQLLTPRLQEARGAYGVVLEDLQALVAQEAQEGRHPIEWLLKAESEVAETSAGSASGAAAALMEARGVGARVAAAMARGELLMPTMDVKCYVPLAGQSVVVEDPRVTEAYKQNLLKVLGLHDGASSSEKFGHLTEVDRGLLREAMKRCSGAFWTEGTPRTTLKCFEHDVEVTGAPVRQAPYRLKGQDQEALERCIEEDVRVGQLVPGEGDEQWLSPAFVVRYPKVRMVVDYRKVNSRTVRSTFLIPRGDDQKQRVASAHLITMLDAVSGFNHVPNTRRARKALAMVTLSGVYLPVCLPFGPLNGPEVFQRLMHEIFRHRLLKEWFIYLDDLAVATFPKPRAATDGEAAKDGRTRAAGSGVCRTPYAHALWWKVAVATYSKPRAATNGEAAEDGRTRAAGSGVCRTPYAHVLCWKVVQAAWCIFLMAWVLVVCRWRTQSAVLFRSLLARAWALGAERLPTTTELYVPCRFDNLSVLGRTLILWSMRPLRSPTKPPPWRGPPRKGGFRKGGGSGPSQDDRRRSSLGPRYDPASPVASSEELEYLHFPCSGIGLQEGSVLPLSHDPRASRAAVTAAAPRAATTSVRNLAVLHQGRRSQLGDGLDMGGLHAPCRPAHRGARRARPTPLCDIVHGKQHTVPLRPEANGPGKHNHGSVATYSTCGRDRRDQRHSSRSIVRTEKEWVRCGCPAAHERGYPHCWSLVRCDPELVSAPLCDGCRQAEGDCTCLCSHCNDANWPGERMEAARPALNEWVHCRCPAVRGGEGAGLETHKKVSR